MKKAFRIIQIFWVFVLGTMILLNLYIIYNQVLLFNSYPTIFGFGQMVITDHDSKLHDENDFLITYRQAEYQKGDEIVYVNASRETLTGIVYQTEKYGCYVSDDTETMIPINSVKGKVIYTATKIGVFVLWLNSSFGMVVLLMTAVLIIEVPRLADTVKEKIEEK